MMSHSVFLVFSTNEIELCDWAYELHSSWIFVHAHCTHKHADTERESKVPNQWGAVTKIACCLYYLSATSLLTHYDFCCFLRSSQFGQLFGFQFLFEALPMPPVSYRKSLRLNRQHAHPCHLPGVSYLMFDIARYCYCLVSVDRRKGNVVTCFSLVQVTAKQVRNFVFVNLEKRDFAFKLAVRHRQRPHESTTEKR